MTAKKKILLLALLLSSVILLISCFCSKKNVYVSPPARTIPLDSVKVEIDPFRIKPEPDSFMVNFFVPGDSSCPVKIEFKTSSHKLKRLITDSVFSAGHHKLFWGRVDEKGQSVEYYRAYYYVITICDSNYTRSFYYRREPY